LHTSESTFSIKDVTISSDVYIKYRLTMILHN